MKQIVNLKRIFIDEDFDNLVVLLNTIKTDAVHKFVAIDNQSFSHNKDLQIIAHRLYTHPQNPTLNVLEVDYVNKVAPTDPTTETSDSDIVLESSCDSESEVHE